MQGRNRGYTRRWMHRKERRHSIDTNKTMKNNLSHDHSYARKLLLYSLVHERYLDIIGGSLEEERYIGGVLEHERFWDQKWEVLCWLTIHYRKACISKRACKTKHFNQMTPLPHWWRFPAIFSFFVFRNFFVECFANYSTIYKTRYDSMISRLDDF